jgi:Calcineurin-like phosphoesterase
MIYQLQVPGFMQDKIRLLSILARDMRDSIAEFTGLQFSEEEPEEINDLDVAELLGSMEALERDETLSGDAAYWLPRNAYAALLQGNLDTYYRVNQSVMPDESRFGETLSEDPLTTTNLTPGISATLRRTFQLNRKDPRWVLVLQAKAIKRRKGTPPFPDNSARTAKFDAKARVLLVGDWGSGVPDAVTLAQTMWNSHLQPELGQRELHVIHLGDVYYAGLPTDYTHRFLRHWPVPLGYEKQVSSWCLAGNHDMYSGGHGFFEMLKDPRFVAQKQASYFLLENADWQVFGLDTSFDSRDYKGDIGELYGEQAAWVARKRDAATATKCLILTHHQPFCAYSVIKENLGRRLRPIRNAYQIDAWFWGHEHLCAVYDGHENVRYPVLLGHGGFPQKPKTKRLGAPPMKHEWLATGPSGDVLFGFAVLDFNGSQIDVQLIDQAGKPRYQFVIS